MAETAPVFFVQGWLWCTVTRIHTPFKKRKGGPLLTVTDFPYVTYLVCFGDRAPAGATSEQKSRLVIIGWWFQPIQGDPPAGWSNNGLVFNSLIFVSFHLLARWRFTCLSFHCFFYPAKQNYCVCLLFTVCHTCVNRASSPHCTSPGTPPPHLWGSSSRGRSGNETRPSWWTGWCGSRSSPRRWCAPAARSPAPGGTPGSRWRHGSK